MSQSLEHDFVLALVTVVPAAILWIALDHFVLGLVSGAALFAIVEYGIPAYKAGHIDLTPVHDFVVNVRTMIRSRVSRRA